MFYRLKDGFIVRKIGGQTMAVPVGRQTSEIHGMISLTESAELLWETLKEGADTEKLTRIITDNYEIDQKTAEADVKKFLEKLQQQGVLE